MTKINITEFFNNTSIEDFMKFTFYFYNNLHQGYFKATRVKIDFGQIIIFYKTEAGGTGEIELHNMRQWFYIKEEDLVDKINNLLKTIKYEG